ncbi:PREDICTED: protein NBR1 homolog [Nelumbo nucifera]|uniref:Protein NBR1 homolog n=2 Tax=Nelumbo nucifera TaxID=4432 RepID=A0A822YJS9_NELNU|nr:PREDICTED: protein NBR1 homolog [Nelumbo nucifera]DAD34444.1 TPA_asm: hypothetical protein HUJ06_005084 [Nelumbo nucifera]
MAEIVIKVKYGDTLRRFNVDVHENGSVDLDMDRLRVKILYLFKFAPDTDLTLTYIDEDKDVVTLVDEDDLLDAFKQCLNPLRINVLLNSNRAGRSETRLSGSSTPMRTPRSQSSHSHSLSCINSGAADVLKSVPEPLLDAVSKLSLDLASKAVSSNTVLADIVENLSYLGLSHLGSVSQNQTSAVSPTQSKTSENPVDLNDIKDPMVSKDTIIIPKTLPIAKPVDSTHLRNEQESDSGNISKGVSDSSPPTTSMVHNLDLPRDSAVPGCPPVDVTSAGALGHSDLSSDNGKNLQEECDDNHKGISAPTLEQLTKSPANHLVHPNPRSHPVSHTSIPRVPQSYSLGDSSVLDEDNSRRLATCTGHSSSQVSFNPVNNYGQIGAVDVSDVFPPGGYTRFPPFKRGYGNCDSMGRIFHKGVRCDGCGIHPITGPRFKSKVKEDYDLCSICFSEMGNEAEYRRIDHPISYRSSRSFKEFADPFHHSRFTPLPHMRGCGVKQYRSKIDSRFIQDVNVIDGTMMAPATPFTKIWRMRNNGSIPWPHGTQLVWIGGDQLTDKGSVYVEHIPLEGISVDRELDIAVDFTTPEQPGRYISYWRMALPSGQKFGQRVWVLIQVDASLQNSFSESFHGLNLNLPAESTEPKHHENIDVNADPMDGCNLGSGIISNAEVELVKPVFDENANKDSQFPINDDLIVGGGASASVPSEIPASVSYPIIDLSIGPSDPAPLKGKEVTEANMVEQTLLKELEEMGFKQADLNKEILRMNDYNLEKSVDDLCGVAEWFPILEELQEMGFHDKEMNKKLLIKNGGSIKRVVLDLIAGGKA